jgi:hypothetical protein
MSPPPPTHHAQQQLINFCSLTCLVFRPSIPDFPFSPQFLTLPTAPKDRMQSMKLTPAFQTGDPQQNFGHHFFKPRALQTLAWRWTAHCGSAGLCHSPRSSLNNNATCANKFIKMIKKLHSEQGWQVGSRLSKTVVASSSSLMMMPTRPLVDASTLMILRMNKRLRSKQGW